MPTKKEPSEFENFDRMVSSLLSVPKSEIIKREQAYKERANANPRKRGPKPKVKPN
jgi:hypothetical protein